MCRIAAGIGPKSPDVTVKVLVGIQHAQRGHLESSQLLEPLKAG